MPEDGYLEEIDRTQAMSAVLERSSADRKLSWTAGLAAIVALAVVALLFPIVVVVWFVSGRRR